MITGKFVILDERNIKTFSNYNDIPSSFDNLIGFEPDYPNPPHTEEQHKAIESYSFLLNDLLRRERYASSN
jgi:hypothetical protein